ncbi:MAG: acyl-CoA dehydrogenase [Chloroflexota bacterium]
MDWSDSPEQAAFRNEVRSVIQGKLPARYRGDGVEEGEDAGWDVDRKSADPAARQAAVDWQNALAEKGWVAPHWPKEYGGAGLSPMEQFIFNQEMAIAKAPRVGGQGVSQLGPTLIVHGTPEQKAEHLPKILSGEVNWRQGYSEPGAGSDLASLQTRAIRDGDEYVVNGQKIWTSGAHYADWLYVLTRTDPDAPKHRGISFLLVDKNAPGITVRPLINMAWAHAFNETFFEDVRVPVKNVVGEINRGWYVGATLLDFERSNISGAIVSRRNIEDLLGYAKGAGKDKARLAGNDPLRHEVAQEYIETEVQFNFSFRIVSMQAKGLIPNYEASTAKLFNSELNQKLARTGTKVFGLYSHIWDGKDKYAPMDARFTKSYVSSVSSTIAAGTSEIQRNIIATRGLGLPRG